MWDNDPHNRTLDKRVCERLESISFTRFGTVIGPGDHLAAIIQRDLRLPHVVRLVPTPVETKARPSERNFRPEGKRMVMYAGTVNRIKGSALLLAIIREYLAIHDDTVFLVTGKPGRSDGLSLLPDLESLTADFPNHFVYHRHLEKADLLAAYSQSDVVLITSLIDNFPNTALEAASQDAILIASETASLGTLLRDGENGFVMTTRSPKAWVEAIRKVFTIDNDTRTRIKSKMRDSLKRNEAETAVRELCRVYREMLGRENG
jgi:glycosyltransferase involved in cell wall biosynthesis